MLCIRNRFILLSCTLMVLLALNSTAQILSHIPEKYKVTWNKPGGSYTASMPAGNGDIGINLWTENNGDIVFLISKTDAWTENAQLVKLGRVRVHLSPNPFTENSFLSQELLPLKGEILIKNKTGARLTAWVDANNPVVHLEINAGLSVSIQVIQEQWRSSFRATMQKGTEVGGIGVFRELSGIPGGLVTVDPDTVLAPANNAIIWLHHNERSTYPLVFNNQHLETLLADHPDPLLNRSFGILMKGPGLICKTNNELRSSKPSKSFHLQLIALTAQASINAWRQQIVRLANHIDTIPFKQAKLAHLKWWENFWKRSWIDVSGDSAATAVAQGYAMQRWMTGASGRGAMPIKYNGGIFTVGQEPPGSITYDPAKGEINADFRAWGGNYWFQNNRLIYWPMIVAGDHDLLMPFIKMYTDALSLAKQRTQLYFHHNGAAFQETIYFWGLPNNNDFGWGNPENLMTNTWIRRYYTGGLELVAMALDEYHHTGDRSFLKNSLLPLAEAITTFYNQHWKRVNGTLRFNPSQALETRQQTVNPAPDIAGLTYILPQLLALPVQFKGTASSKMWQHILQDIPPLPIGHTDSTGKHPQLSTQQLSSGKEILLDAEQFEKAKNVENPELYSVFPFALYGVNLPGLTLARDTYQARLFPGSTCWTQDGIQAACLGLTDQAKKEVIANFTAYGTEKFKWFWKKGHDWEPDLDNGGAGQITLQRMLLQTKGDQILLFPAWPKEWNVDFKLHAPQNTTLEGCYKNGKITKLQVTPASRKKNILIMI